jgi:hypothetical protein
MIYVLLLGIAVVGFGIYVSVVFSAIPGAVDERLGVFDELPESLGTWFADLTSPEGVEDQRQGLVRETRFLLQASTGLFSRETLVRQVRQRDAKSGEVLNVLPEQRIPRRRKRA